MSFIFIIGFIIMRFIVNLCEEIIDSIKGRISQLNGFALYCGV